MRLWPFRLSQTFSFNGLDVLVVEPRRIELLTS